MQGQDTCLEPRAEESYVFLTVQGKDRVADEDNGTEEPTVQKPEGRWEEEETTSFCPLPLG